MDVLPQDVSPRDILPQDAVTLDGKVFQIVRFTIVVRHDDGVSRADVDADRNLFL